MHLTIERLALEALTPYANNARTHSEAQVAQIAASIAEFGFVNPVLIDGDGTVIAGHGRLLAARQLGLSDVPVVRLAHLTDTQRRALTIADNRIAENAGWNEELLRLELGELKLADFDLGLIGFDADALDALFADSDSDNEGLTDDDAVPETQERVVSQPGDVWVLGEHKVLCGDATVAEDYERLLGTELADMAFLDPPYNANYANSAKDKLRGKNRPILNDNLGEGFDAFLLAACTHLLAVTKGAVYIAMSSWEVATLQAAFRAAGGKWSTFIIWAKNTLPVSLPRVVQHRPCSSVLV
jgi:ParB-like chromosome segregation protein Spo0J